MSAAAHMSPLEIATLHTRAGIFVTPVPNGTKAPNIPSWQELRLTEPELPTYFNSEPMNQGAILGPAGLTDMDLDCEEARASAEVYAPETGLVYGYPSSPASHRFYYVDPPEMITCQYRDPLIAANDDTRCMILELRCLKKDGSVGLQSLLPGSTHPDTRETYRLEAGTTGLIQTVDREHLKTSGSHIAGTALLKRYFAPTGSRHNAFLALAGILARAGRTLPNAFDILWAIYLGIWGHEADRSKCRSEVATTYAKHEQGGSLTGIPTLKALMREARAVDVAFRWMGIETQVEPGPPTPEYDKKTGRLTAPIPTIGNTLLYHHYFAKNDGEKVHIYKGGAYHDHGELAIRQAGRELMNKWSASAQWKKGIADEVSEWVNLASPCLWERPPLDRINLLNGIWNLTTGKLEPHTADWLSPIQLPISYDPDADCPEWDSFLQAVLPPDVYREQVTFQLAALLMIPYTAAQRALLLRGPRGTAKSRYLAALRSFVGAGNTSTKSLHTLEENRFACQYLYGKLANICPDLPHSDLESTSKFKAITGEDFIDAEYKHGRQFQFRPFCRLLFSANQAPQSKDASDAFLDRWWVVPFERRFQDSADQIPAEELDSRLSAPRELSGVLNRALRCLPQVLRQRGITQTTSMRDAHDEFCAVTDPFRVWLSEYITDDLDAFEPCSDVIFSYSSFLRERGAPLISKSAFGLELRKQKRGIQMAERTVQRPGGFSTPHCYLGIRLKRKGI